MLIQIDEATLADLNEIAPAAKRQRAEFIRRALKEAIREHRYRNMREAYRKQPDSGGDGDDWSNAEAFEK
jgi:metal-responsive CopG/Arc/MetJ family transcriptional regulator